MLVLYGGPGSGANENFRRIFNPALYRIILFDQRGAGRSTPSGELRENTTDFLVSDIEFIRKKLGIKQWVIFGESWGTTLGLLYAEKYPQHILSLILRGILLANENDIAWFYKSDGVSRIYPEAWETFTKNLTEPEQTDILSSYYQRLLSDNESISLNAVKDFVQYGKSCNTLLFKKDIANKSTDELRADLSGARIEAHYYVNKFFLEPNFIMKNIGKLEKIPGTIIHGRYDMCCTVSNAYLLHKAWPSSQLHIVPDVGHSVLESGYHNVLVDAANAVARKI